MKTKIFSAFFILFLCLAAVGAVNASADTYGNLTYKVSGNTITITRYYKSTADVVIPSEIDGKVVTSIGDSAFRNCTSLASIIIPDSVTSIGNYAFSDCSNLTSVTIPDSVTSIGNAAFLETQFYNNEANWENGVLYCGKYLLSAKTSITECNIKKDTKLIADSAFRDCTSLASITIPDSVTNIGEDAFYSCKNLNRVDITDIAAWCKIDFEYATSNPLYYAHNLYLNGELIANLEIPDGVTSIGDCTFRFCTSLTSITIPDSVTSIGWGAFSGCTGLTSITIPDSVTSIGGNAFDDCKNLAKVTIPDSVTSIGVSAFSGCSSLTSVTIPDSVTSIGWDAFSYCRSLNRVDITDLAAWCKISIGGCFNYTYDLYLNGDPVKNLVIPDGITSIGRHAFEYCSSIMSVTIPDSVTSIDRNAFYRCENLNRVDITDLAAWCKISIGDCFEYTTYDLYLNGEPVKNLVIPDGVTYIGAFVFSHSSIMSVTIPDSVTRIGWGAFSDCKNLAKVTIPDSVTSIGKYAFGGCSSIMSVTIPDSVTRIDDSAFSYCTSLASITIPDSVTSIGDSTFSYCTSLTDVIIPDSVTSIGRYAFSGCENIKYVFFKGSRDFWDNEMLIYKGNDALNNAEIICDPKEKTYNFVTNCEKTLSPVTAYYIAGAPNTETLDRKKYVTGWYDNPVFSGVPVKFPYYSDKTTLYAKLADRTGGSFESAVYLPENGSSTINKNIDNKYWTFIPEKTGEYIFKSTSDDGLYLYNSNKALLASGSNSITFSLAAGEVYYIKNTYCYSYGGTLTVTQADYKGTSTSISNNGKNIRVVPTDVETGTKIAVALYNGDKFVGTKVATYRGGAIEFTTNTEYTSIKVMAWDADNLTPCAKAEVVER